MILSGKDTKYKLPFEINIVNNIKTTSLYFNNLY